MSLFLVLIEQASPTVTAKLAERFPGQYYAAFPGSDKAYLVNSPGATSRDVASALGLTGNASGDAAPEPPRNLVVAFQGYYGWNSQDVWEWIGQRRAQ